MKRKALLLVLLSLCLAICLVVTSCSPSGTEGSSSSSEVKSETNVSEGESNTPSGGNTDSSVAPDSSDDETDVSSEVVDSSSTTDSSYDYNIQGGTGSNSTVDSDSTDSSNEVADSGNTTDSSKETTDSGDVTDTSKDTEDEICTGHKGGIATCEKLAECEICGEEYGILANHTEETINGKEPTCEEAGLTEGKKCSVCGDILLAQEEIDATGHNYVEGYCTVCGLKTPSEGLSYALSGDGTYYIVAGIGTCTDTDVVIPSTYEGLPVTAIVRDAFRQCESLTSINIPSSITNVGTDAFLYAHIESVNYRGTIEQWCRIDFHSTRASNPLNGGAKLYIKGVLMTKLVIPSTVIQIGDCAFTGCSSLTNLTIQSGITSISYNAFSWCENLVSIEIPNSVTSINRAAFMQCVNLASIEIPSGVTNIGDSAFSGCQSLTSVEIPSGVTRIGENAFFGCTSLTSIEIPSSVTSIGFYAFSGCTSLTSIEMPSSVTSIGDYAFSNCDNIKEATMPTIAIEFLDKSNLQKVVINGGDSIGEKAFSNCNLLTSVTFGDSVSAIGDYAFSYCTSLKEIVIPNSIKTIGYAVFSGCSSLENLSIPFVGGGEKDINDRTTVFGYIFGSQSYEGGIFADQKFAPNGGYAGCYIPSSLKSVTVTGGDIPYGAFDGCSNLTSIIIPTSATSIGPYAFLYCTGLTSIEIPNSVISIGEYAFAYSTNLTSVEIPNSVISVGKDAFSGCTSISKLTIGNSVETIGSCAFEGCNSLISIIIPSSITSMSNDAFCNSFRLVEIYNLSSVEITIDDTRYGLYARVIHKSLDEPSIIETTSEGYVFAKVSDAEIYLVAYVGDETELVLPETYNGSYYQINRCAFYNCDYITAVIVSNGVTSIGKRAFDLCDNLTSVSIGENVESIGEFAFYGCGLLEELKFNSIAVNDMHDGTFDNAGHLGNGIVLTIGEKVTKIPSRMFAYWGGSLVYRVNIKNVIFAEGSVCQSIGEEAFREANIQSIVIPDSITSIGDGAFSDCSSLTSITVDESNKEYKSIDGNLYTKDGKTLIQYASGKENTEFVLPSKVTSIGKYAFNNCRKLESVIIHNGVTSIDKYVFYECTNLTRIVIPSSVTSVDSCAFFYSCPKLTIYCEAESQPAGWHENWNNASCPVEWGYKQED